MCVIIGVVRVIMVTNYVKISPAASGAAGDVLYTENDLLFGGFVF